jgi:hypothetical protein
MGVLHHFPGLPALRVVEQSPAGRHEFPGDRPRVDITPGLDGYRVWLLGTLYAEFRTLSNASRCASALMTLDALDCLPDVSVRRMLERSVEEIGGNNG